MSLQSRSKQPELPAGVSQPATPITEEFITVRELAERLHVKPCTIYEWTRRQTARIPHFPISRKVILFRWSDVVRWIEAQAVAR
jgi:excisionase family DNA binding protein